MPPLQRHMLHCKRCCGSILNPFGTTLLKKLHLQPFTVAFIKPVHNHLLSRKIAKSNFFYAEAPVNYLLYSKDIRVNFGLSYAPIPFLSSKSKKATKPMQIHELDGFLKTGEAEPYMWLQLTFIGGVVCRRRFCCRKTKRPTKRTGVSHCRSDITRWASKDESQF